MSGNSIQFRNVADDEKTKISIQFFENVADTYDLMNDVVSVGIHRFWRKTFIQRLDPTRGMRYLDMAGGTGSIAFRIISALDNKLPGKETEVVICDISQQMLDVGKRRAEQMGHVEEKLKDIKINWVCADGENLPFDDNSYDIYTIGFGLRNCTRMDKVLSEAFRVLKKGGRFLCLELGHLSNSTLQWLCDLYRSRVIPIIGGLITGDSAHYYYLADSVKNFPKQEDVKCMIEKAGFEKVQYENLSYGVVSIFSGFKPT